MNPIVLDYLNQVSTLIGAGLDRLKLKSPILYTLISLAVGGLTLAFSFHKISINPEVDSLILIVLVSLSGLVSPRTSQARKEYETKKNTNDSNTDLSASESDIDIPSAVESDGDSESL